MHIGVALSMRLPMTQHWIKSKRRKILKGIGMGALASPLFAGTTTAEQASCSLNVSVEAGEGDESNWTRREYITDDFRGKIDVSGSSGTTTAYLLAVLNPDGELTQSRSGTSEVVGSSSPIIETNSWNPNGIGPFGTWQSGMYHIHATVSDSDGNFGAAVSDPFEVNPT